MDAKKLFAAILLSSLLFGIGAFSMPTKTQTSGASKFTVLCSEQSDTNNATDSINKLIAGISNVINVSSPAWSTQGHFWGELCVTVQSQN